MELEDVEGGSVSTMVEALVRVGDVGDASMFLSSNIFAVDDTIDL